MPTVKTKGTIPTLSNEEFLVGGKIFARLSTEYNYRGERTQKLEKYRPSGELEESRKEFTSGARLEIVVCRFTRATPWALAYLGEMRTEIKFADGGWSSSDLRIDAQGAIEYDTSAIQEKRGGTVLRRTQTMEGEDVELIEYRSDGALHDRNGWAAVQRIDRKTRNLISEESYIYGMKQTGEPEAPVASVDVEPKGRKIKMNAADVANWLTDSGTTIMKIKQMLDLQLEITTEEASHVVLT